ncbi:MAG: N-acetyltransferase [Rhodospirillales bacterium]
MNVNITGMDSMVQTGGTAGNAETPVMIRPATTADISDVQRLDERNTGLGKPAFWADAFRRYGQSGEGEFLVAEQDGRFAGYIVGEVRAWEFGSPPSGWIFAFGVEPEYRLAKIATRLFEAICDRFRARGVEQARSMVATDDHLNLAFLRAQGMRGGPFLQLEMNLNPKPGGEA